MKKLTACLLAAMLLSLCVTASAFETVQAQMEKLPTLEEFQAMDLEAQQKAYLQTQTVYEAYLALPEEEQAKIQDAEETFGPLFQQFNTMIAYADEEEPGKTNGLPLALALLLAVPLLVSRRRRDPQI